MIYTCTVYYLFPDELDELVTISKNAATEAPIVHQKPVESACEIYMCALIIQLILVTTF